MREDAIAARWSFLERQPTACSVVSHRMELLYLNAAARALVASDWFGTRCWQTFPVEDESCAASCAAVRAVNGSDRIVYCEEELYPADGSPLTVGVAVIPLDMTLADGERSILLLRPKDRGAADPAFCQLLLADAAHLRETALARVTRLGSAPSLGDR